MKTGRGGQGEGVVAGKRLKQREPGFESFSTMERDTQKLAARGLTHRRLFPLCTSSWGNAHRHVK